MAERAQPLRSRWGLGVAACVAALILGALAAVVWRAEVGRGIGPADWAAIRFTVVQAILSAGVSVALAVPAARALARRRFPGRRFLIALMGAPFILPVIVAILGILAVFGRSGWLSDALAVFGFEPIQIYGLHGVVLAHVFFNLPLATRLILQGWQEIPAERFRLAAQINADPRAMWRLLEAPMLGHVVPGALAVVFAICLSSFAVALTLGGGPRATTIELAIYQAFRFDFDLGRAALLSGVQLVLTGAAAIVALRVATGEGFGTGLDRSLRRWDGQTPAARIWDSLWICAAALFLILPLSAIVLAGVPGLAAMGGRSAAAIWSAAANSVVISAVSTGVLVMMALPMAVAVALGSARGGGALVEMAGLLGVGGVTAGDRYWPVCCDLSHCRPLCAGAAGHGPCQCADVVALRAAHIGAPHPRNPVTIRAPVALAGCAGVGFYPSSSAATDAASDRVCRRVGGCVVDGGSRGYRAFCG